MSGIRQVAEFQSNTISAWYTIGQDEARVICQLLDRIDTLEKNIELYEAERSSAFEAADILLQALGWSSGGLGAAAIEIVKQRDQLEKECVRLQKHIVNDFHGKK